MNKIREQGIPISSLLEHLQWLMEKDQGLALSCLKKYNRVDAATGKDVLHFVKDYGGREACVTYLEYLTLDYNVQEAEIHTELAVTYFFAIKSRVKELSRGNEPSLSVLENDEQIFWIRKRLMLFLERSNLYKPEVLLDMFQNEFMLKEIAMLLARAGKYVEAFEVCVLRLNNVEEARRLCEDSFRTQKDRSIYLALYQVMMRSGLVREGLHLAETRFHHMPFDRLMEEFPLDLGMDM